MPHLTDEQIEDVIQTQIGLINHLAICVHCRQRVNEQAALAKRLRRAFISIHPDQPFREQLKSKLEKANRKPMRLFEKESTHKSSLYRYPFAIAALIAVVLLLRTLGPPGPQASTAQELEAIHRQNLSEETSLHPHTERAEMAGFFQQRLGFTPRLPETHQNIELRGCCIQHFQGQAVASYVTQTQNGPISVLVLEDRPESLSAKQTKHIENQTYWYYQAEKCNLVGTRLGKKYYYAIGTMSHTKLQSLLAKLQV